MTRAAVALLAAVLGVSGLGVMAAGADTGGSAMTRGYPYPDPPTTTQPPVNEPVIAPDPDTAAPETQIVNGPKKKSRKRRARFDFSSSEQGVTFQCNLDGKGFSPCASPLEQKVGRGRHTLEVRALDSAGNADSTPAAWSWRVKRP